MFEKPLAHQSNATPLRSSSRRQLLASISSQYPTLIPTEDVLEAEGMTGKEVGRMILPEGVRSSTFETSGGVDGQFYSDPDTGDVLWMSIFGKNPKELIPTLSLLSLPLPVPPLPMIELHNPIPPPILTGAPLFIAAVKNLTSPWLLPDVSTGSIVAFTTFSSTFSPSNGDIQSITEVRYVGIGRIVAEGGMRGAVERRRQVIEEGVEKDEGRFCDILCIIGDHSKPKLQSFQPPPPISPLSPNPNQNSKAEAGPSRPRSNSISTGTAKEKNQNIVPSLEQLDISNSEPVQTKKAISSSEISTLLSLSLLQSLQSPPPLPVAASLLYSAHILPNRPSYIPQQNRDDVIISKSDWKKLGKWMKEVSKDGLIKIKETKGEIIVISIDTKHPSIENHVTHTTIAEEELKASKKAARQALQEESGNNASTIAAKGKGKEILIEEMWRPSSTSIQFWEACGIDKTKNHPPTLLKSALETYASTHNLTSRAEPRYYLLDEELGRACGVKKPVPGSMMSKDEIVGKLRGGVIWSVSVGGVVKKGTLSPILLTPKVRAGRKTITLIQNLETFSIPPLEFAEELKKLCAGSTTVTPLTGAATRLGLSEVMVQGNQVKVVSNLLMEKGVPRKWIKEGK